MEEIKYPIYRSSEECIIPIDNTGVVTMFYTDYTRSQKEHTITGVHLSTDDETFNIKESLMWPHYMFKNHVGYFINKLLLINRLPNLPKGIDKVSCWGNTIIEYKKIDSDCLSRLMNEFQKIENDRVKRGLRFGYVLINTPSLLSNDNFINLELKCNGHYVNGSYVHDYEAAVEYVAYLNDKFYPLRFKYVDCDSSNDHLYTFTTDFYLSYLIENIDQIIEKVATEGIREK